MADKLPAFQFYPGDWVQDTRCLTLATKGAWIDLLCAMWRSQTRGTLTLPLQGYARLISASPEQTAAIIKELTDMQICNSVTNGDGSVTLSNRRMVREQEARSVNRLRTAKWRNKARDAICDADVTSPSSSSSSSSNQNRHPLNPPPGGELPPLQLTNQPEAPMRKRQKAGSQEAMSVEDSWGEAPWPSVRALVALYNRKAPEQWPLVRTVSNGLDAKIRAYLKQFPNRKWWEETFEKARRSKLCQEYKGGGLSWMLQLGKNSRVENCAQIHDGAL